MISRRDFLKLTAAAGVGLAVPFSTKTFLPGPWKTEILAYAASPALAPFVDGLSKPPLMRVTEVVGGIIPFYHIKMSQFNQKLHRDLLPTPVWGYGGTYPAHPIRAKLGTPIWVRWENNLPFTHLLNFALDHTLPGIQGLSDVRTSIHLHSANLPTAAAGNPLAWFTPNPKAPPNGTGGPAGNKITLDYPNLARPGTFWYHDHALAIARLNLYAGLAGLYILHGGEEEAELHLPAGRYEIPLTIQDRVFNADGTLFYPTTGSGGHPLWVAKFFGDTAVVNGKVWPHLDVEPRRYRFRLLNGCNARFLNLSLDNQMPFLQIGNEGGFLSAPQTLTSLFMAPAFRCDIVLDFTGMAGQTITLTNNASAPFPGGGMTALSNIMQFRVNLPLQGQDTSRVPAALSSIARLSPTEAVKMRSITLNEILDAGGNPISLLLGEPKAGDWLNPLGFLAPVRFRPTANTVEIWRFLNLTPDAHPIHIQGILFQVLDKRPFDVAQYKANGTIAYTGPSLPPDPWDVGWKGTVRADPGFITRIIARFGPFAGKRIYHSCTLEHADNDMKRPFEVV